ncbi:aldehyde dehydrogenase family protein [Rhodococcus sp. BP-349]|uniref:aldehyde dehydrogenase family protein n=1 Tax=unclassified Rhodococcus (in: high G+C Gram-positive bacteria) TaxID=192944 RepID=UPI001C9ADC79|nr:MULTISPECIES: aldehyde dehydrogenase family protein [unclassified Rhodococcus (in: high G+C Gram-positive bacteria)]MBY6537927.1 aldehyde dehydrogenase family protein [Rhodococcus sp. BP-363]MBY6542264.1 aldehyde dehydrogenase family protein [Rhodococcus sp. BP-369]MBY6561494.1 aldehyde dehydrogenase family protein [Rhodococcus sp. BP-370]MBY6575786.1 aldehyde dehydrogenase family protein [Rhodococcus sp. BP-364]MBY6585087.1 aldehyde dehydrogenase family protein [Rhodococcus sp. BP-358]
MSTTLSTESARAAFVPEGDYEQFIGGEWVRSRDAFDAVDPSVGSPWAVLPQGTAADVESAVAAAGQAFTLWRRTTQEQRQALLLSIADRFESDGARFGALLATENGRPVREAGIADIPTVTAIFRFYAGVVRAFNGEQIPLSNADTLLYTKREPLGVVAAIISWNSPLITFANKVAPALAAGNTVVVKPSEYASASILEFTRLIADLLPAGVLNIVTGFGPETGAALVSHPGVAKISFTGGPETARAILGSAAQILRPSLMELGGKGPMIVAADADLDLAVQDALMGIYLANGQACIASSRLLLHDDIHDDFVDRFAAVARTIRVGDATDPRSEMGPLVSRRQLELVSAHVAKARAEGVSVVVGDEPLELDDSLREGFYHRPVLLADPEGRSTIVRTEVFGPVTVAERYRTDDEAIARANASPYGLAAGVWTQNLRRAHQFADRLNAGIVWVNRWFDLPPGMPMGGRGDSGFGRELSFETLREYTAVKSVNIDLGDARPPLWGLTGR